MTTINNVILNQTSPTNFLVDIPDNDYTKGLKLQIQGVTLPGINIPVTTVPTNPMLAAHIAGSAIEYDPLILRIAVDEELKSYLGCYIWMLGTNDYQTFDSLRWREKDQTLSVHILDNSQSKVVATMHFHGAFPSNLGELDFMYTGDIDEPVTCMVTINFKDMDIEIDGRSIRPVPRKGNR